MRISDWSSDVCSSDLPIRATKLRYFEDSTFKARVLPPPVLAHGDYTDRPAARTDDWAGIVRGIDARLGAATDSGGDDVGGGLEQARHPGHEIDRPQSPEPLTTDQLALGGADGGHGRAWGRERGGQSV